MLHSDDPFLWCPGCCDGSQSSLDPRLQWLAAFNDVLLLVPAAWHVVVVQAPGIRDDIWGKNGELEIGKAPQALPCWRETHVGFCIQCTGADCAIHYAAMKHALSRQEI